MLKIADLKKILKENDIKFYSYWNKKKFVEIVKKHGLYPEEKEDKKGLKKIPNYDRLKDIAKNPKKVTLKDVETEEVTFPSIYKASKFIDRCPQTIENWNGRVWNGKYRIDIL